MYNSSIPTVIEKDHPLNKTGLTWVANTPPFFLHEGELVFKWYARHPLEGVTILAQSSGGNIYDMYGFQVAVAFSEAEALVSHYANRLQEEDKAEAEAEAYNLLTNNKEC